MEYQNVAETEFHENQDGRQYEPHGTRFDLGPPKFLN